MCSAARWRASSGSSRSGSRGSPPTCSCSARTAPSTAWCSCNPTGGSTRAPRSVEGGAGRAKRDPPHPPHALELVLLLDPLCGQGSFVEELEAPLEVPPLADAPGFPLGAPQPVAARGVVSP